MAKPHLRSKIASFSELASVDPAAHHGASRMATDVAAWMPRRGSADSVLLPELQNLRDRSRDMDRNNGVAKGATQTIIDNVVGTGLRLSARPDYKSLGKDAKWARTWARKTQSLFCAWWWTTACDAADQHTGDQLTNIQFRSGIGNGEFCALPLWIPDRGDGFSTKIQTIEPDRLSQPDGSMETARFRGGIERDVYGMPIAYHFKKTHPDDPYLDSNAAFGWDRVARRTPFGRLQVIHGFDPERSGQSRGKPLLSSILPQFKQIDRYTNAEIMAAVVNAMLALIIESPMSHEQVLELFEADGEAGKMERYLKARQDNTVSLQMGTTLSLFPGDKAASFMPQRPASGFGAFCENIYRIIGVGMDLPYELVMKDFSKTNYSSARAALLEAWRSFSRRRDWLGTQWMDPLYGLFLEEMVNAGRVEAPGFYEYRYAYQQCRWIGPGRGWIDPVKEAEAAAIRIANGLSTLEEECAQQGLYWEDVLEQLAIEMEYRRELGLPDIAAPAKSTAPYPSDVEQEKDAKQKEAATA